MKPRARAAVTEQINSRFSSLCCSHRRAIMSGSSPLLGSDFLAAPGTPRSLPALTPTLCGDVSAFRGARALSGVELRQELYPCRYAAAMELSLIDAQTCFATCAQSTTACALARVQSTDPQIILRLNRAHALNKTRDPEHYARFNESECSSFWRQLVGAPRLRRLC